MAALAARPRLPPPSFVEAADSATASPTPHSTTPCSADAITLRGSSQDDLQQQVADGKPPAKAGQPVVDLFPAGFPLPDAGSKRVGVCFEHLVVEGSGGTGKLVESLPISLLNSFNVWSFVSRASARPSRHALISPSRPSADANVTPSPAEIFGIKHGSRRALIQDVTGLAEDGEVLLVLGRPGSGCSTLRECLPSRGADDARSLLVH